mgnify:FL=1
MVTIVEAAAAGVEADTQPIYASSNQSTQEMIMVGSVGVAGQAMVIPRPLPQLIVQAQQRPPLTPTDVKNIATSTVPRAEMRIEQVFGK